MTPQPQHPQRCETCTGPCPVLTGSFFEDRLHRKPELARHTALVGCASHSSAGAQQRIEQVIMELEKIKGKCDAKTSISEEPFHTGERAAFRLVKCWIDEAITLLQAGDGK